MVVLKGIRQDLLLCGLAVMLLCSTSCGPAMDEGTFPQKPITLIVYTGPGGLADVTARKFVDVASKHSDATFIVENRPGAGGLIAIQELLHKPADGYALLASTKSNIAKLVGTGADAYIEQIDWLAMLMADPECVITRVSADVTTWQELVEHARDAEETQLWVGPARGGLDHVTALKIWAAAGLDAKWIPFKSGGKAIAALLGDQGAAYVGNPRDAAGNPDLHIAAVSSTNRLAAYPDVPTFGELGLDGLDREFMWRGFAIRQGVPVDAVAWYDNLFQQVSADPEWREFWEKSGIDLTYRDREEFRKIVAADQVDFARSLKGQGLIQTRRTGLLAAAGRGRGLGVWTAGLGLTLALLLVWASRSSRRSAARVAFPLLCVAGGGVFLAMTFAFPVAEEAGPDLVPRLWIGLLTLVGLSIAFSESRRLPTDSGLDRRHIVQVLRFSILLGLYLVALPWIGYLVTTGLFLITAMVMLGERRPVTVLGVTAGWLVFSYLVFVKVLYVQLPVGRLLGG
jgi:tripartite-type tricarboxylate transporter receptor subunit TctC